MIVVDTTLLVYAVGAQHPLKEPSRRLFAAAAAGLQVTTTAEVIQEFTHVRARRRPRADAVRVARGFAALLSPLLVTDEEALDEGLGIYEREPTIGSFDAVLAATAIAGDAEAFVSADAAFASITGLRHVAPASAAFERLLS